jgi:signal transduction histidine kinase
MSRPDGASWVLILLGSAVFVAGVIAIGVLESHRTAGAAYAIRRSIDQIREGQTGVRVKLRRGDHLQELAKALNQLAETLDAQRSGRS